MIRPETSKLEEHLRPKKSRKEQQRVIVQQDQERLGKSVEFLPPKKSFFDKLFEILARRAHGSKPVFTVMGIVPIMHYTIYLPKFKPFRPCSCCWDYDLQIHYQAQGPLDII